MNRLVILAVSLLFVGCLKQKPSHAPLGDSTTTQGNTDSLVSYAMMEPPPESDDTTVKTDSSTIETKYFEDLNSIREFNELDSINRTYYKDFYFSTRKLNKIGVFEQGNCVGLWKYYDEQGALIKTIDFDTGERRFYHGYSEPYVDVLLNARAKADSILRVYFGAEFIRAHIRWNVSRSYFYGLEDSGDWFDIPTEEPMSFKLSYFVMLDATHKSPCIEFTLNGFGEIKTDETLVGLAVCKGGSSRFALDHTWAMTLGRQYGLNLTGRDRYFAYLSWVKPADDSSFLGDYEFILAELKTTAPSGENETIETYAGVVLDPWTGKLKRKTAFQRYLYVHRYSASSSSLIERL